MASYLHLDSAPSIVVETRRKAQLAITRLHSETGTPQMSLPIPSEHAFTLTLQLHDNPRVKLWLGQRLVHDGHYPKGGVCVVDLQQEPTVFTPHPYDCVQLYIPYAALNELADDHRASRVEVLSWPRCKPDPNFHHLAMSVFPELEHPERTSRLFTEQVMMTLLVYSAQAYGNMQASAAKVARGGLAPWQRKRATELLRARLDGDVTLSEVAAECGLSVSHFARSFKQTIGQTPHRWLLDRRVDEAKNLLMHSGMRLSEIALGCGFADQTSFTRAFKKAAGTSPGDWRRMRRQ
jgi:AraC-like DNA-binding protein